MGGMLEGFKNIAGVLACAHHVPYCGPSHALPHAVHWISVQFPGSIACPYRLLCGAPPTLLMVLLSLFSSERTCPMRKDKAWRIADTGYYFYCWNAHSQLGAWCTCFNRAPTGPSFCKAFCAYLQASQHLVGSDVLEASVSWFLVRHALPEPLSPRGRFVLVCGAVGSWVLRPLFRAMPKPITRRSGPTHRLCSRLPCTLFSSGLPIS